MDYQKPDPEHGSPPSGPRVEDDVCRQLKPTRGIPHLRVPTALPFAIAAILVVSSVAFGASVMHDMVPPNSSATPVVVGDDDPTDSPSVAPTDSPSAAPTEAAPKAPEAPEAPPSDPPAAATPGQLTISVDALAGKAKITWSAYTGDDFAYYKVVRSTDATAAWPLGTGDKLVAAIDKQTTLTYTDCSGAGTFTYAVFAVTSADTGYTVLAESPDQTVTVAPAPASTSKPPAPPASNPADLGALNVKDNGDGTYTFSWNAYTGSSKFDYYKLDGQPFPNTPGYVENGGHYWQCVGTGTTSVTMTVQPGTWNVVVEAVYLDSGPAVAVAKTSVVKLVVTPPPPPTVVGLTLTATAKTDGVHLTWTKYTGNYFDGYVVLRSESTAEPQWPLAGDAKQLTIITCADQLSYVDKTAQPGHTYHYRVYAFSSMAFAGVAPACTTTITTILAVSNVADATVAAAPPPSAPVSLAPTVDLGALNAVDNPDGSVTFSWTAYTGGSFSYYKLVYETTASGKTPSYPGGSPYWAVPGTGDTSTTVTGIAPGDYQVRIQAIGYPNGSAYAYAQTSVIHVHIAAPQDPAPPSSADPSTPPS